MSSPQRRSRTEEKVVDAADWQTRMRAAFFEAVTTDDMREIVEGLVKKAKAGDAVATRMLLGYAIGSPQVSVKNAVFMGDLAPLPTAPSKALPATPEKLSVFERRAANGQELFSPKDARHGNGED